MASKGVQCLCLSSYFESFYYCGFGKDELRGDEREFVSAS